MECYPSYHVIFLTYCRFLTEFNISCSVIPVSLPHADHLRSFWNCSITTFKMLFNFPMAHDFSGIDSVSKLNQNKTTVHWHHATADKIGLLTFFTW